MRKERERGRAFEGKERKEGTERHLDLSLFEAASFLRLLSALLLFGSFSRREKYSRKDKRINHSSGYEGCKRARENEKSKGEGVKQRGQVKRAMREDERATREDLREKERNSFVRKGSER